jgi:HAD superfamily hydrolase (TIGR01509 family)
VAVGSLKDGSILGVVFDVGGVLRRPQPAVFARIEQFGLTREDVLAFFLGPDAVEAQMAGQSFRIADMVPVIERALSSRLGEQAREAAETMLSVYVDPDPAAWDESMVELLNDLHEARYKTGLLANAPADLGEVHFPRLAHSVDATVLSGLDGVGKPMAGSYELIVDRLGLRLEQCFFVDDNADNVDAARCLGMKSHCYTGEISLLTDALRANGITW